MGAARSLHGVGFMAFVRLVAAAIVLVAALSGLGLLALGWWHVLVHGEEPFAVVIATFAVGAGLIALARQLRRQAESDKSPDMGGRAAQAED